MIETIERMLENGNSEEARRRAQTWQPGHEADAATWARWGDVLDRLGMTGQAVQAYQEAVRRDRNPEWFARLAELYLDLGRWSDAEKQLQSAIDVGSTDPEVFLTLGELLEERDEYDAARAVYETGLERTHHPEIRARLKRLPTGPSPVESTLGRPVDDAVVALFLQYFQGREGVYARQWVDRQGRVGYQPVREPLTASIVRAHLNGDITIGVYPVRLDNTVTFIAWDVDINRRVLEKHQRDTQRLAELVVSAHTVAVQIADRCAELGLPTLIEDSGFKGRHVWLFLSTPFEARLARTIALRLARSMEIPRELHVDVFPRQDEVAPDQLGNLIKLPLGIHRRTGRRCLFLDTQGHALPDPIGALMETPRIAPEALVEAAKHLAPLPPPTPTMPEPEQEARAIQSAVVPPYHAEADPEFQAIVTGCPAIGALVEKARTDHMLTYDEQLVVVHTLGHLTHGVEIVNAILGRCINVYPQLMLKSPLRGNPMSCPKIRQRIPHITKRTPCRCPEQVEMGYPTPVLFVRMMQTESAEQWEQVQIQAIAETLLRLDRERQRLERQIRNLQDRLIESFQRQGQNVLETPYGTLRLIKTDEGYQLTIEPPSEPSSSE